MFEALLITLREGIEAALVVGLVLLSLQKSGRSGLRRYVFAGVGAAVLASAIGAWVLRHLPVDEEIFEGVLMWTAAVFVAGMLVWMHRTSKHLRAEIDAKVRSIAGDGVASASGSGAGTGWGLALFVFVMVVREGIETVLFLSAVSLNTAALQEFIGGCFGILLAVAFAVGFVRGGAWLDLRKFFAATTAMLLVLVVQLAINGYHELSEAGVLPATKQQMAIIGPIVRNNTLFLIAIMLFPLALFLAGGRSTEEKPAGSDPEEHPAEARKRRAARRSAFALRFGVAGLTTGVLALLTADIVFSAPPAAPAPTPLSFEEGVVRVRVSDLADGNLHTYSCPVDGRRVRFLCLKTSDGKLRTAFDACEICGEFGYAQQGEQIICLNCTAEINALSIGRGGGCNPIPLASEVRGDSIVVGRVALAAGTKWFQATGAVEEEPVEIDPVCRMRLLPAQIVTRVEYGGKRYAFCGMAGCAKAFQEDPERFVGKAPPKEETR